MLRDARDIAADTELQTGVCIVGSGPAGLTLARELAGRDLEVLILESGGLEPEQRIKDLANGDTTGDFFKPLCSSRVRQFGGTANMWDTQIGDGLFGFRGAPMDPIDFQPRDWLPHYVGWPFGVEALEPYYARAHQIGRFGPYDYRPERWEGPESQRLFQDSDVLTTAFWQFGARRAMIDESRRLVERARNVTALLHATAVEIETNDGARLATRLRVATLDGTRFTVAATQFVLAAGGIENARLLLGSSSVQRNGLGNQHDLVGRYFMEHQQVRAGDLIPADRELFHRLRLYDQREVDGVPVMGTLQFTEGAMRRERLLNMSATLVPRRRWYHRVDEEAVRSVETLARSALRLQWPANAAEHVGRVLGRLDYVAAAATRTISKRVMARPLFADFQPPPDFVQLRGWSDRPETLGDFDLLEVLLHVEQAPHPDNRITLGHRRDAFGNRLPVLHWEWRKLDIDSVRRAQRLLAREFARAGLGRMRLHGRGRPVLIASGLHHHMGTTRMHPDPRRGVVDEHGRVHGVGNLYVTGCSIFPTAGFINPTLTIMALALRLADRLRDASPRTARATTGAGSAVGLGDDA